MPTLIVDGAEDLRPRDSVDSLERSLPEASRVIPPGAGHLPWAEDPAGFRAVVSGFLATGPTLTRHAPERIRPL